MEQRYEYARKSKKLAYLKRLEKGFVYDNHAVKKDTNQGKTDIRKVKERKRRVEEMVKTWKIGTWNVRGINGKEDELNEEFEKVGLDILGVTETKKKGKGETVLKGGHVLLYSGVDGKERAREGVGCIIEKKNLKYLKKWTGITERILKVTLEIEKHIETTIVVAYGPNEDEVANVKDNFWEQLTEISEEAKNRLIIVGDLNGRVGSRDNETGEALGYYGENVRTNNGRRIIDFCIMNNLIVTNSFYEHRDIHKYTREMRSRNEISVIDYILIDRTHRHEVQDTRVRRGPEIYSDHFLLLSKLKIRGGDSGCKSNRRKTNISKEVIKTYRLRNKEVTELYRTQTELEMSKIKSEVNNTTIESQWKAIRDIMIKVAKQTCGSIRVGEGENRKQTRWWSEEIRAEVKSKKEKWRIYLGNRTDQNYDSYKLQRVKVREMVKTAKQKSWEEFGEKMEEDSKGNQKLFYTVLKRIRKGEQKRSRCIRSKQGEILVEDEDIMSRWKEHFEEILDAVKQTQENDTDIEERIVDENRGHRKEIEQEEVEEAVRQLKRGKAAGHDRITPEMLKGLGKIGMEILTDLYNKIWHEEKIPEDWEVGIILPIHKKGDNRECTNYRGITLLSVALKVYERLLDKRLKLVTEEQLDEVQSGFRKGRGVQDHIFTMKQLTEKTKDRNFCVAFIDLEKAFDSVPRENIWKSLKRREVDNKLSNNIKNLYKNTRTYVRTGNLQSSEFVTSEGLRQGGVLSPTLFNVLMDDIIKEVKKKTRKLQAGYRKLEVLRIGECAFADDLTILARNEEDMQYNMEIWKTELEKQGLKINIEKTKVMSVGEKGSNILIKLNGSIIEQTDSYRYLGVMLHESGRNEAELNNRVESAMKIYYALNKKFIRKKEITARTKMSVYNTVFKPILTYGSESWVLTQSQRSKIQAVEMKYLRGVRGVTKMDKMRSDKIRHELKTEPVLESIKRRQLRWFGHIVRMNETRQVKQVWQTRTARKRTRGRPKKTWDKMVEETLKERGLTWKEGEKLAKDKKAWLKVVHG